MNVVERRRQNPLRNGSIPRELKTGCRRLAPLTRAAGPGRAGGESSNAQRVPQHPSLGSQYWSTRTFTGAGTHTLGHRPACASRRLSSMGNAYTMRVAALSQYRRAAVATTAEMLDIRALYCFRHVYITSCFCANSIRFHQRTNFSVAFCPRRDPTRRRSYFNDTLLRLIPSGLPLPVPLPSPEFYFLAFCIKRWMQIGMHINLLSPARVISTGDTHSRPGNVVVIPTRAYTTGNATRTLYIVLMCLAGMRTELHHCNGDWVQSSRGLVGEGGGRKRVVATIIVSLTVPVTCPPRTYT